MTTKEVSSIDDIENNIIEAAPSKRARASKTSSPSKPKPLNLDVRPKQTDENNNNQHLVSEKTTEILTDETKPLRQPKDSEHPRQRFQLLEAQASMSTRKNVEPSLRESSGSDQSTFEADTSYPQLPTMNSDWPPSTLANYINDDSGDEAENARNMSVSDKL